MPDVHTPEELRDLLFEVIVGAAGGDEAKWREALGDVENLPIALNAPVELGSKSDRNEGPGGRYR